MHAGKKRKPVPETCGSPMRKVCLFVALIILSICINIIGNSFLGIGSQRILIENRINGPASVVDDTVLRRSSHRRRESSPPDGTFNGIPFKYVPHSSTHPRTSIAHCVGENFRTDAWHYRSCEVHHFCFDIATRQFFATTSQKQTEMEQAFVSSNMSRYGSLSSTLSISVSLRAIQKNQNFKKPDMQFNLSVRTPPMEGYYELPPEIVWIPIFSTTAHAVNPGHLLWDMFLPVFTLLSMFGHENKMTPFVNDLNKLCTLERTNGCFKMISKFIPFLGVPPDSFSNNNDIMFNLSSSTPRSKIVCAKHALLGIGMLNDHGRNRHGQNPSDYAAMRNMGRGPELFRFRKFILSNMGIYESIELKAPYQILVSQNSTNQPHRRRDFQTQIAAMRRTFSIDNEATVKALVLSELTLREQLESLTQSTVFISVMGGGAAFASFLPRGSLVVLFFDDVNDWTNGNELESYNPRRPVMMDWDFFNNAAYLQVHWFPLSRLDSEEGLKFLIDTVQNFIARSPEK